MKNILIIGGNGYIGSYLKLFLESRGLFVDVYGSRNSDYNVLTKEFLSAYQYIILLAGHSSVASCDGPLASSWNNNVRNFSNLVNKLSTKQKLIYASSSSVYGNKGGKVYNENDVCLNYINNYDITKNALDFVVKDYIANGNNIIGFRFGTVNGPSPIVRTDLMINAMVHSALTENIININNKNISRPILSINDLGRAMLTVINGIFYSGIYNLASFNSTVDEIASVVSKRTKVHVFDHGNNSGVYDFATDTSLFRSVFNFEYTGSIESIIGELIHCYNHQNPKLVKRNTYYHYEG